MAHPPRSHRLRAPRARAAVSAAVLCAGAVLFALTPGGGGGPGSHAAAASLDCSPLPPLPINTCTTTTTTHSTTSQRTTTHQTTPPPPPPPPPTTQPGQPQPAPTEPPPGTFPTPPPALPYGPGAPPAPPALEVQTVLLIPSTTDAVAPGSEVAVQVTCEAKRGTDTYSVPHAPVTAAIDSSSGSGAAVVPETTDSGDTGAVVLTVRTGDRPGDTVLHVTSGSASAMLTLHSAVQSTSRTSSTAAAGPAATGGTGTSNRTRLLLSAALGAFSAAILAALAVRYRRGLPSMRRRSVWGRRSS